MNIDYRKMNFIRLALIRDNKSQNIVELGNFVKLCKTILKINNFESTELYEQVIECLEDEQFTNDNKQISMAKLSLLVDLYYYLPYFRK
jgi:hypothetical protein